MNAHFFFAFMVIFSLVGCNSDNKKEKEQLLLKEQELINKEKQLNQIRDSINLANSPQINNEIEPPVIKYVYVKVVASEPHTETDSYTGDQVVKWQFVDYCSKVMEIENFTEDKKAQLMDNYISSGGVGRNWTINGNGQFVGKIIDRKCIVFNSYSEASEDRFKNCGQK